MERWGVRFMPVPPLIRETCERYGPDVIADVLTGDIQPSAPDLQWLLLADPTKLSARDWLTERLSIQEYRDRWIPIRDFVLEIVVIAFIGWEIHLSGAQETQQSHNFADQQRILSTMNGNTADTAKAMTDAAASLKTLSDDQKTANGNVQLTLDQTRSMATALKQQLDILKQEQAARRAELSRKPSLELYAGDVPLKSTGLTIPVKERTETSFSYNLHLKNGGTAAATNGELRIIIQGTDVQLQTSPMPSQELPAEPNAAARVFILSFPRIRKAINLTFTATFTFPKGHAPFQVAFNVDDDEGDSAMLLGAVTLSPVGPSGQ